MKTESSSFRLDKEIFEDFKRYAKDKSLTTNALVNKIMKAFIEWGSKTAAIQLIPEPSQIILELLQKYTEEEIRKIGRNYVKESFSENLLLLKNEETVEAYFEYGKNWCDASGFAYSMKEKNGVVNFTVRHNQGKKYSILLDEIIRNEIEILTKKRAKIKMMSNSVSLWV